MKAKAITFLIVVIVLAIILLQNMQAVTFRLFFWKLEVSQLLLVAATLLIGFLFGFLIGRIGRRSAA